MDCVLEENTELPAKLRCVKHCSLVMYRSRSRVPCGTLSQAKGKHITYLLNIELLQLECLLNSEDPETSPVRIHLEVWNGLGIIRIHLTAALYISSSSSGKSDRAT